MSARRIIGLGQPFAGDDAVGLAVIAHLRAQHLADLELCEAVDATELITLLAQGDRAVLVDGAIGVPVGLVRQIALDELDNVSPLGASSHGIGVHQAIGLAGALSPGAAPLWLRLIGIGIAMPTPGQPRLSPTVRTAISVAAALAVALVRGLRPPDE
jgi:hydrogenase maturation protease